MCQWHALLLFWASSSTDWTQSKPIRMKLTHAVWRSDFCKVPGKGPTYWRHTLKGRFNHYSNRWLLTKVDPIWPLMFVNRLASALWLNAWRNLCIIIHREQQQVVSPLMWCTLQNRWFQSVICDIYHQRLFSLKQICCQINFFKVCHQYIYI